MEGGSGDWEGVEVGGWGGCRGEGWAAQPSKALPPSLPFFDLFLSPFSFPAFTPSLRSVFLSFLLFLAVYYKNTCLELVVGFPPWDRDGISSHSP